MNEVALGVVRHLSTLGVGLAAHCNQRPQSQSEGYMTSHPWIVLVSSMVALASSAHGQEGQPQRDPAPSQSAQPSRSNEGKPGAVRPYTTNLFRVTEDNDDFRRVLFTGTRSQLVAMSIPPGESIGTEKHGHVEQMIVVLSGSGETALDGKKRKVGAGDVIVVTPGTTHDLLNTGKTQLKVFTTYVPPNHIDGRVHRTKADAARDVEDERFGQKVK
jgi:mannose-6-phosphate isomerase-like protein (cupin superfamily)